MTAASVTMDVERARFNMIEQQIRPWEVLDENVLAALRTVPRERFVPDAYRALAFADLQIPLGHGEVMMEPKVEARMVQELRLTGSERVLEVGTGSGYVTALTAHLGGDVVSVDIRPDFTASAGIRLRAHGFDNVSLVTGDGARGWDEGGPWDAIIVTGSLPILPDAFRTALKAGGRLVVIIGQDPVMEAVAIVRVDAETWHRESLFDTSIPPLLNAETPSRFRF
jgi:protein-L-isoaspartate(D-aspartate) O-methyltransferase